MRILFICNSFGKGWAATAHLATELAEGLVERGYEVEVWARGGSREHMVESCGRRIAVYGDNRKGSCGPKNRVLSELRLLWNFCLRALGTSSHFDSVVCMDSPRFASMAAGILKRKTGAKTLAWVMDLAFEQVVQRSGRSLVCLAAMGLTMLQIWTLSKMDRVITLGDCMASLLKKRGLHENKITVIGTWAEDHWASLSVNIHAARKRFNLHGGFIIMYAGFAADWHDFDSICEAISETEDDSRFQWVFAGSGPGIDKIRELSAVSNWPNVVILDRVDRSDLPSFLSCADLHLVSLRSSMLGTCVPSKLYPLMALSKPAVFVGPAECQTARDLVNAGAGEVVADSHELVEVIYRLAADSAKLKELGENANRAFRQKHCANVAITQWYETLMG
ncbi:glycosyltransferase family 4 protein [Synoicihabitans lomoniglobus]|uniref:Glycosyltransferase family 4 protein n=1 Tax=Synoicihabitans lomoniglobus TaxID=2909285 RepID=A0AAF0CQU7_9BACT|nr:glycosyltransferase family 4 protein [Opitutaceae bacterium LMO-M01]WED66349.1 glycosyltransferase family 4 protein [Opitutaceae bacterium LMO-M01]